MSTTISSNDPSILAERGYKDLDLNFTAHPVRKDINKFVNEYAIVNSVKNLILTNHYERPFDPDVGTSVSALLFEPMSSLAASQISSIVENSINNYEPRANLQKVVVSPLPDKNAYNISIQFLLHR